MPRNKQSPKKIVPPVQLATIIATLLLVGIGAGAFVVDSVVVEVVVVVLGKQL